MAVLTTRARKALPTSDFAEPGQRAYPVNDLAHARNALSRVSQFGSPAEKAAVRGKVRSKFPALAARSRALRRRGGGGTPPAGAPDMMGGM